MQHHYRHHDGHWHPSPDCSCCQTFNSSRIITTTVDKLTKAVSKHTDQSNVKYAVRNMAINVLLWVNAVASEPRHNLRDFHKSDEKVLHKKYKTRISVQAAEPLWMNNVKGCKKWYISNSSNYAPRIIASLPAWRLCQ